MERPMGGEAAKRSLREIRACLEEATLRYRDDAPWWLAAGAVVFVGTELVFLLTAPLYSARINPSIIIALGVFIRSVLYAWLFHLGLRQLAGGGIQGLAIRDLRWRVAASCLRAGVALAAVRLIAMTVLLTASLPEGTSPDLKLALQLIRSAFAVLVPPLFLFVLPLVVHSGGEPVYAIVESVRAVARRYVHWAVFLFALLVPYALARILDVVIINLLQGLGPVDLSPYVPYVVSILPTVVVAPWIVLAITVAYRDAFGVAEEPPAAVE